MFTIDHHCAILYPIIVIYSSRTYSPKCLAADIPHKGIYEDEDEASMFVPLMNPVKHFNSQALRRFLVASEDRLGRVFVCMGFMEFACDDQSW